MKKRIQALIVDDESELRKSVISVLRNSMPDFEFDINEASDGKEAVEKFKTGDWDLVLMDVRMPELTGIEALKLIKAHDPKTFVVLMTAHSNLQDAVAAIKELGPKAFGESVAASWLRFIDEAGGAVKIDERKGLEAAVEAFVATVQGKTDPSQGIVIRP